MTDKEKELIVYCLKANSDFHGEVCEECKNFPKCDHFQADSLMEKLIEALEQETEWIPVSERLPNHAEYVKNNGLFNVSDGNRSYSEWFDIYKRKMFGEPTMSGFRFDYAVKAWMPLPEPYKEEGAE